MILKSWFEGPTFYEPFLQELAVPLQVSWMPEQLQQVWQEFGTLLPFSGNAMASGALLTPSGQVSILMTLFGLLKTLRLVGTERKSSRKGENSLLGWAHYPGQPCIFSSFLEPSIISYDFLEFLGIFLQFSRIFFSQNTPNSISNQDSFTRFDHLFWWKWRTYSRLTRV